MRRILFSALLSVVVASCNASSEPLKASSAAEPTQAYWDAARYWWGHHAHRLPLTRFNAKINSDDNADIAAWHVNRDNPDGDRLAVMAVVETLSGAKDAYISFPFNTDEQYSLCAKDKDYSQIKVSAYQWEKQELTTVGLHDVSPHSIRIEDEMCDSIYLFWPEPTDQEMVEFTLFRH